MPINLNIISQDRVNSSNRTYSREIEDILIYCLENHHHIVFRIDLLQPHPQPNFKKPLFCFPLILKRCSGDQIEFTE